MEYIEGESLSKLLRAARDVGETAPAPIVAAILVGVLHGLHAAHEAKDEDGAPLGIVHRDVSPQNIIVGIDGVPRVLDFGIAHAAVRVHTTEDGSRKGKVAYMAPEQLRGEELDRRADVFATAVVCWEALTGKRLFAGDSPTQIAADVANLPIDPPSTLVPGVPPELDEVVMNGLARDREERFQTARAMAVALESAAPLASARRIGEWVERLAERALADRSARVAAVESTSTTALAGPSAGRISQVMTVVSVPPRAPAHADQDAPSTGWPVRTELSATGHPTVATSTVGRSFVVTTLIALACVALGLAAYARMVTREAPRSGSDLPPRAMASVAPPPEPRSSEALLSESAPSAPAAPATVGSSYSFAASSSPPRRTATTAPPRKPPAESCVPPYVIEDGVKRYKPECVH